MKRSEKRNALDNFITSKKVKISESEPCSSSAAIIPSASKLQQRTLAETLELKQIWDINNSKAQKIHYKIAEMIALDCQPISVVEDIGFNRLLKQMCPNYNIPSRKFFSEKIIPSINKSLKEKVNKIIMESENISLTTDIWTNNANSSFISLTGHCIDSTFNRNDVILRVKPFPGSHTGRHICETIQEVFDEYQIPDYKIHLIARDNGTNMVKGIEETGYNSLSCFLHTLQLAIHDAVFNQRTVKDVISNCKKICTHFNHSQIANRKLEELQETHNLPKHKLLQDVPTRWNSTYMMLEHIFEQKTALSSYCVETADMPVFDANKWAMIGKLSKILKVFNTTTVT